ncbi:MAG: GLPGLI family protein [Bacteroidales bacterium]|nr:GLPGLI family protein [Bacteroidales bacterium]
MKTMLLSLIGSLIFITGTAQQTTSGKVTYEETAKMEIKLEGESSQFADMLPKERKSQQVLYFTPDASLYKLNDGKQEDETVTTEAEGAMIMVKMIQPDNKFYADLINKKTIEQRDFMSRIFLVENTIDASGWKITGNQKTILGYPCQEAVQMKDSSTTVAWFAPSIPVSSGPGKYLGLPGLVLAVDIDNGRQTIIATSVETGPVGKDLLIKPKGGKKVSPEEYEKIVDEKRKEMEQQYGSGGGVVIKIEQ